MVPMTSSSKLSSQQRSSIYLSGENTAHLNWWNEQSLVEQAFAVEGTSFKKATCLHIHKLTMTPTLAVCINDHIQDHRKSNNWTKLIVSECHESMQLERVMDVGVNTFSNVVLSDMKMQGTALIKSVIRGMIYSTVHQNKNMKRLELREIRLSYVQTALLAKGLAETRSLKELSFGTATFDDPKSVRSLAVGLRANQSIQRISLVRCKFLDKQIAQLAAALCHHPQLEEIDLSGNYCRRFGLRSLSRLLSMKDCRLRILKLNDQYCTMIPIRRSDALHVEELLDGLKRNSSLRTLELCRNELNEVDALLSVLWKCPELKALNLLGNRITTLKSWRCFWSQAQPSRLQKLELSYNPFHYKYGCIREGVQSSSSSLQKREEHAKLICRLLEAHPELHYAGKTASTYKDTFHQDKIQHFLDLNKTGRVLVANNDVPLSVWPVVMEKANQQFDGARRANVIFHLLRGPLTSAGGSATGTIK